MKKKQHSYMFKTSYILFLLVLVSCKPTTNKENISSEEKQPNVLIILTDQLRAQSTSYAGDPNVNTPHLDNLEAISVNFKNAVSGMPVCTPFKASLITGQRPLTNGVFVNDVQLDTNAVSMAKIYNKVGYDTGFIGKWHIDGHGRESFIPPGNRRQGFQFWMANECTHNYNSSIYYDNNDSTPKTWNGYDTFEQTDAAINYINSKKNVNNPFLLMLSWGTPHNPYDSAPKKYRDMFNPDDMELRPNVPENIATKVRKDIAGYYAHIVALDDMVGKLIQNLKSNNQLDNTIIVFTSDHGDLLGSQGAYRKQQPFDESVRVPMLVHIPKYLGIKPGKREAILNSEDILPTLLSLCQINIPEPIEGINYKPYMQGKDDTVGKETIITCVQPFGEWNKPKRHGREYRGLVTEKYTYVKDLNGPWLLFNNEEDPHQMNNLVNKTDYAVLQSDLDSRLTQRLKANGDQFLPGTHYLDKWGIKVDHLGTVPYKKH